ncbi:putative vps51 vps67 protein [Erysiphe necator]|uniref:Vacuolar protein sorting-associated protein 51 homolog n=1 Tax=Uncinula necator TaxID=52586 RepID=A0A0B1PC99_UNCNE|nr:putative vps51 vps67 protein [Erysiphe necator]
MGGRTPTMPIMTATGTPSSSTGRPSIDYCPNNNFSTSETLPMTSNSSSRSSITASKLNRVALREYYNLREPGESSRTTPASITTSKTTYKADDIAQINTETNSVVSSLPDYMPYEPSELDQPDFDIEAFVKRVLEEQTLVELLATYNSLLLEIRALDSEQKALVYDNYSKLITATETIARMRECVESGEEPTMTGALSLVNNIFSKAEVLKKNIDKVSGALYDKQKTEGEMKKIKARNVARRVLDTPEKVRRLVKEGNHEEARKIWEEVKVLLLKWKDRGVGGPDVIDCLEDGDRALRGEPATERSWINIKDKTIETQP